jgi:DNA-directed RNA polymerase specialized sigma24 family protein
MSRPRRPKNPDTAPGTGKYYLTNGTLLPEVIRAKKLGYVTPELAKMLMLLTERYARSAKFSGYSYRDDMIAEALANLSQNALKFDPNKSSNPFAYYTTAITNSFIQYLNVEKRHRNIRDSLLVELGENPSFNYAEEHKQHSDHEGEQHISEGIAELQKDVAEAKIRMEKLAEEKAAELAEAAILAASEAAIDEVPTLDNPPEEVVEEEEKPKSKKRVSHKPGSKTHQNLQAIKHRGDL